MSTKQRFFKQVCGQITEISERGQESNAGFLAVAVSMIDHFLDNPRAHIDIFKKILEKHYGYFHEHRPKQSMLTTAERVKLLHSQLRINELVSALAYTLRQIAIDEVVSNPVRYQYLFADRPQILSSEMMRSVDTALNDVSLAALATRLHLAINIHHSDPRHTLPLTQHFAALYQCPLSNPQLELYKINGGFSAKLNNPSHFMSVKSYHLNLEKIIHLTQATDPSAQSMQSVIREAEHKRLHEYEEIISRLSMMVKTGELNKTQLLNLYIRHASSSKSDPTQTAIIGAEYGGQHHFDYLKKTQKQASNNTIKQENMDTYVTRTIIEGIAAAVVLGQMNAKQLYDDLEVNLSEIRQKLQNLN